jgi:H+/Cl- antiporter ClcA
VVQVVSAASGVGYDSLFLVQAFVIGVGGAAFGLVYVLMAGVLKAALRPLRSAMDARIGRWPRCVVLAGAGGAAVGALGWAMPLVLTDGSGQLPTVMAQPAAIGSRVLAASAFAKALAYHLAGECGFSGGLFLPMLSMSTLLGAVIVNETGINPVVALSCSSIALGASLIPAPAMLALLANSLLLVGPQGLIPIAATAFTAHLLCMGVGLPQSLLAAVARRKAKKAAAAAAAEAAKATQG